MASIVNIGLLMDTPGDKRIYSFSISAILLVILAYLADFSSTASVLSKVNIAYLSLGFAIGNLTVFFQGYSWFKVFRSLDFDISFLRSLKMKISCLFIDNLTPFGGMGGETAVAYVLSKSLKKNYSRTLSAISFVGFSNLLPFFAIGFLGSTYFLYSKPHLSVFKLPVAYSAGLIILLVILIYRFDRFRKYLSGFILPIETRFGKEGFVSNEADRFLNGLKNASSDNYTVLVVFSMSMLSYAADLLCFLILATSLGLEIKLWLLAVIVSVSRIANFTPSIGGSGVYEATLTGLLVALTSLSGSEAFSLAIIYRATTAYFGILAGFISINSGLVPKRLNPRVNKNLI